MLDEREMRRLVDMQQRSYALLKWMASAVKDGFIVFGTAHSFASLTDAAEDWILGHYANIPPNARPARDDLSAFCAFFSTYLTNSFDLIAHPGKQLYSPKAHCFCPMCSWLVDAPNLKAKKVRAADKRLAGKLKADAVARTAAGIGLCIGEEEIAELLEDARNSEDACLVGYGYDLMQRVNGIANGPAVLALWRGFAWTTSGSPKRGYCLRAEAIIDAEKRLADILVKRGKTEDKTVATK